MEAIFPSSLSSPLLLGCCETEERREKRHKHLALPHSPTHPQASLFSSLPFFVFLASSSKKQEKIVFSPAERTVFFSTKVLPAFAPFLSRFSCINVGFLGGTRFPKLPSRKRKKTVPFPPLMRKPQREKEGEGGRESRYLRIKGGKARVVKDFGGA